MIPEKIFYIFQEFQNLLTSYNEVLCEANVLVFEIYFLLYFFFLVKKKPSFKTIHKLEFYIVLLYMFIKCRNTIFTIVSVWYRQQLLFDKDVVLKQYSFTLQLL